MYKIIAVILTIIGIILSTYLYITYLNPTTINYCNINDYLNCSSVEQSPYSKLFGIPLPIPAIIWFTITLITILIEKYQITKFLIFLATIFVAYLIFTEVFLIGAICIYCTITQIIGLSIYYPVRKEEKRKSK
jgi:uncharacterized membrane protein